jgi:hypothetical protein
MLTRSNKLDSSPHSADAGQGELITELQVLYSIANQCASSAMARPPAMTVCAA